jgi:tetratricopeptide (TPR) repeat protein
LPGGNRERAAAAATKALDLLDDDRLQRARAHMVLGAIAEPEKRMGHLDKAVEFAPRDAEIRRARAHARLVADQFAEAREDLLVAVEEDPEDAAVFEALGLACTMADRLDEAEKAFDKSLELEPDSPGVLLQRARLLAVKGQQDRSIADVDKAIQLSPDNPQPRVLRARIDMQSGNMNLRDPVLYRVRHATHPETGDKWCIYPMYDYAHPISDALEAITHSLCTLEFQDHRPLYDWVVQTMRPAPACSPLPRRTITSASSSNPPAPTAPSSARAWAPAPWWPPAA